MLHSLLQKKSERSLRWPEMLKWLTDENVPRPIVQLLRDQGYDVKDVHESGLAGCKDPSVISLARQEGRILVTADKDFSNLLLYPLGSHAGIVVLKMERPTGRGLTALFHLFLDSPALAEVSSALVIVQRGKVRIRKP
ncbi:hypothetical protein HKBW3S06_00124 [Candidatus Hakubella thermalkaliphila]|nr:DUF5615 family PIN-like protein [Candidatus Hakubella thermalkaliphila]GFP20897.1 hypothetical protein HKBW3S06_00124 [Candidatus Hakubella thermalkaliphila]GFP25914.1 hypothetical protein HKBW3S25_01398 [Candidatus Hakubella thermalkaliphila]GFP41148.1 hypothetical protein HKBW3C_00274 [Candidatus Hakubella thermalkaliphila]